MTSAVTNFWFHLLTAEANNYKNSDKKILSAIGMGKDSLFYTPKISKYVDE